VAFFITIDEQLQKSENAIFIMQAVLTGGFIFSKLNFDLFFSHNYFQPVTGIA